MYLIFLDQTSDNKLYTRAERQVLTSKHTLTVAVALALALNANTNGEPDASADANATPTLSANAKADADANASGISHSNANDTFHLLPSTPPLRAYHHHHHHHHRLVARSRNPVTRPQKTRQRAGRLLTRSLLQRRRGEGGRQAAAPRSRGGVPGVLHGGDRVRREACAGEAAGRGDVGGGGLRCLVRRGHALQADGGCCGWGGDIVAEEPGVVEGVAVPAGEEPGVGCHRGVFALRRLAVDRIIACRFYRTAAVLVVECF